MVLKNGNEGERFEVVDMDLPEAVERRLEVLGLTEGSQVLVMNNKKRGAMVVKIRGSRFALGQRIAESIIVKPEISV